MIPNHILLFAVAIPNAVGRTRTSDLFVISEKRIIAVLIPNRIALIKLYQLSYHGIFNFKVLYKIALSRILTSCNFGTADYAAVSRTVRWAVRYDVQQFIGWVAPGHLIGLSHALARYLTTLLPQPSVTLYSLVPSRKDGSRTHINRVSRDYRFSITEALTIKLLSDMPLAPVEAVDILAMSLFSLLLSLLSRSGTSGIAVRSLFPLILAHHAKCILPRLPPKDLHKVSSGKLTNQACFTRSAISAQDDKDSNPD